MAATEAGQAGPQPVLGPAATPGAAAAPAAPGPPAQLSVEPGLQLACKGLDALHDQGAVTRAGEMEDRHLVSPQVRAGSWPAMNLQASSGAREGDNIDLN